MGKILSGIDASCCCRHCAACDIGTTMHWARLSITGVAVISSDPEDCQECPDWNDNWDMEYNGDVSCTWTTGDVDLPCFLGNDPITLHVGTYLDGGIDYWKWILNISGVGEFEDLTGVPITETMDCREDINFDLSAGNDGECDWSGASGVVSFSDSL